MRQHRRVSYRYISSIRVTNRLSGDDMGYVGDLSLGGLRMVASEPLVVGGCYEITLHVPEHGERVADVPVTVICQWSRRDSRRGSFEMGFSLDRPAPEFSLLVQGLLKRRQGAW
ncbi:PilZ domain-containing protein [Stutzerimonas urumqiensis]|uniref:PilZ domain-containing protein n=1 Tax=Stutzerimonas urumqiensis TaxID=638269 RepID=UPI000EB30B18|nr:PilZ domain-containing protein [Stutzerimonas urumqiensis]